MSRMKQFIFLLILLWCNNSFAQNQNNDEEYKEALKSINELTQSIKNSQESFKKTKKATTDIQSIIYENTKRLKKACSDEIVNKSECEKEKKYLEELENKNKEIITSLDEIIQEINTINLRKILKTGINNKNQILELKNFSEHALLKAYFQDKTPVIINSKAFCESVLVTNKGDCSKETKLEATKIKNEIFKESDPNDRK